MKAVYKVMGDDRSRAREGGWVAGPLRKNSDEGGAGGFQRKMTPLRRT